VQAAYIASLESQISSLRDELATVYKTQGQNAQRLLAMNETLREKEEISRVETENLRQAYDELTTLRKKIEQHNELMLEKDRTAQVREFNVTTKRLWFRLYLLSGRSSTMRLIPFSSSSDRSRIGTVRSQRITRSYFNDGLMRSKLK
jgi:septal ring factor EnvC (AmiA/AmiB activator)